MRINREKSANGNFAKLRLAKPQFTQLQALILTNNAAISDGNFLGGLAALAAKRFHFLHYILA